MNKPIGSKLLKLKDWLTLHEAARHLSAMSGEELTEADILQFGLNKKLKLSVYLVNKTPVKPGHWHQIDQDEINESLEFMISSAESQNREKVTFHSNLYSGKSPQIEKETVIEIKDLWDLPMYGGECNLVLSCII